MSIPLVPAPVHVVVGSGSFKLTSGEVGAPPQLAGVAQLFADEVGKESEISLTVAPSDSASPVITVEVSSEGLDAVASASGNRADGNAGADERYGLDIAPEGVRVWAATPEGVFRGLTSLRQLIAAGVSDGVATLLVIEVVDGPRHAWRGLSFDVVRTFHGPETVRRVIDLLAVHKLNVLHVHLTDDQGWRIEVPSRPALTEVGSTGAIGDRPGGFYTVAEMAELVKYAADRFITIVPEIDMPGHTGAIFRSYPELAPTKGFSGDIAPGLAVGTLDPGRPETWEFVGDVLDDIIPQFPNTAYIHVGGDEAFGMPVEEHAAQDVPRALEMGTKLIVSPTSRLYFDRPQGDASLPIDTQYEEVRFGFNKSVLTGLLCDQLGFDGTVCTD